jgi:hypothetical protein
MTGGMPSITGMGGRVEVVVGGSVVVVAAAVVAGWVALVFELALDEFAFGVAVDEVPGSVPTVGEGGEAAVEALAAQAEARLALTAISAQARANENGNFGKGTRQR